jgi:hypothetical protein
MAPPAAEPKNRETGGHYAVTIDSLIPSSHPSTKPGQVHPLVSWGLGPKQINPMKSLNLDPAVR